MLPAAHQRLLPAWIRAGQAVVSAASQQASSEVAYLGDAARCSHASSCTSGSNSPQHTHSSTRESLSEHQDIRWVFLGPPGVGKGTYASRAARHFGVAHIATGDLIREEIKACSSIGRLMKDIVSSGKLVPDELIFRLLEQRLQRGHAHGEHGFILDGFPRTRVQAETLLQVQPIQLALNMSLREEVLVEKCLGRRICKHCGKNYNIADIHLPAAPGRPEIRMPPLAAPPQCAPHLEVRADDTEEVVRRRLQLYKEQAGPVEDVFAAAGVLHEFEITAGIPETLPGLLQELSAYMPKATATEAPRAAYA